MRKLRLNHNLTIWKFLRLLAKEQPGKMAILVFALVAAGLFEGSSVALFVPLLQLISSRAQGAVEIGRMGRLTQDFLAFFGFGLSIGNVLVLIFIAVSGMQAAMLVQQRLALRFQYDYEANLRESLYKSIFLAEWSFFFKNKAGDVINALITEAVRAGKAFYLINLLLATGIVILFYSGLALFLSWQMALAAVVIGAVVTLALQGQIRMASQEGADITQANSDVQNEAIEQVMGSKLAKGCAVEEKTIARFHIFVRNLAEAQFRTYYNNARLKVFNELAVVGLLCVGIYFAAVLMKMPIATLTVFLIIFYRMAPRISNLQTYRRSVIASLPAVERIKDLADEAGAMLERGGTHRFKTLAEGIVFRHVDFEYDEGRPILKDISFSLPKGKTIAIVGSSGAGKSTVVDLIMSLIYPQTGTVLLDGRPLSEYDLGSWRRKIGYVAQDTVLFHSSVKENIAWTADGVSQSEIEEAARLANAFDFIEQMPDRFETIIGDRGVRLSGGQKQRLALAGALIRHPEILILDEATSALDAESEKKIQTAVESLAASHMTIVIVTHRLATVKNADIIYVLDDGKLVEEGNWETLIKDKGRFNRLKRLQALD